MNDWNNYLINDEVVCRPGYTGSVDNINKKFISCNIATYTEQSTDITIYDND